ncbi:MAG TPA: CBS domain-containing protein [Candidatus Methylomirabilis sp.]|nr:CBS domain-containing protein [Candidatus Methylomirabilis sp.]
MSHPKRAITREIRTRRPKRVGRESAGFAVEAWPESGMQVSDVMTSPAIVFRQDMTLGAAVKAMRARKIRHAPVVNDKGALIGMVTDRDLRQAVLEPALAEEMEALARTLAMRTVKDVMTWGVTTVKPETGIRDAARLMHTKTIGALPVIRNGRVAGMLTSSDVIKALIRILDEGVVSKPGRWGAEG